jgi:glycosyltransferase involved in cell wall biosynthesis
MNILMMASSTRIGLTYHLTELSLGLKRFGHNIVVVSSGGEQQKGLEKLLTDANIPIFTLPRIDTITVRMKSNAFQLRKIIDSEQIDIIHANGLTHLFNASCGKKISSRKPASVMSVHAYFQWTPFSPAYLIAENVLLNVFADLVLPVSNMVGEKLVKSGLSHRKIMVVHNALNLNSFDKLLMENDYSKIYDTITEISEKPVIMSIGQLLPHKGHVFLLKAIGLVKSEYPNIRCVVTGTGPLKNKLQKVASSLGIESNVIFTGYLRYEHVLQILKRADIGVVTSLSETFCHAMIEPLAAGRPIITTPVGIAPEIMKYDVGLTVPKRDPKALASAIIWLLEHPNDAKKMGHEGRKVVERMFSMDVTVRNLVKAYELACMLK